MFSQQVGFNLCKTQNNNNNINNKQQLTSQSSSRVSDQQSVGSSPGRGTCVLKSPHARLRGITDMGHKRYIFALLHSHCVWKKTQHYGLY